MNLLIVFNFCKLNDLTQAPAECLPHYVLHYQMYYGIQQGSSFTLVSETLQLTKYSQIN